MDMTESQTKLKQSRWAKAKDAVSFITTIALLVAAGTVIWNGYFRSQPGPAAPGRPEIAIPEQPISIFGVQTKGSLTAPVALVIFSDFECPFCARFARETLPTIEKRFVETGQVLLTFRHLPLQIHPLAVKIAAASECAGNQGQFWPFHDKVFAETTSLTEPRLRELAAQLPLQLDAFAECSAESSPAVERDRSLARELGVQSTPVIFVGSNQSGRGVKVNRVIPGAMPLVEFENAIKSAGAR